MVAREEAAGHSDIGTLNTLHTFIVNLRPRRVLEVGTHIGTGAVVIGSALRLNGYGKLLTLEPHAYYQAFAAENVKAADLTSYVEIIPHFSYDPECQARLRQEAPFEIIYIDAMHYYDDALFDITLCAELLAPNGMMFLHDTGVYSPEMDQTGKGGVRRALNDFSKKHPEYKVTFLEYPLWLNPCGLGIVCKEVLSPPP